MGTAQISQPGLGFRALGCAEGFEFQFLSEVLSDGFIFGGLGSGAKSPKLGAIQKDKPKVLGCSGFSVFGVSGLARRIPEEFSERTEALPLKT